MQFQIAGIAQDDAMGGVEHNQSLRHVADRSIELVLFLFDFAVILHTIARLVP